MYAFNVSVNGEHVCTAGIGPKGVLSVIVNWAGGSLGTGDGDLRMNVGGLDTRANEHVRWPVPALKVGDRVTVEVIRTETVDPPPLRHPTGEPHRWTFLRAAQGAIDDRLAELGDKPATRRERIEKRLLGLLRSR